ncbi:uncharacterized protein TNCV_198041 [Trichonephila clavipes]|nr:uncharacterized protein TNCV_198041 [Trichonephila clavipes]
MITNFFIPELNNHDVQELWFQQDGATCHTARASIDLLKDTFGDRLISRFGPVNWPPRSCDLTPLDYFLWGYVKSLVYADKPQTLDHLEDNIRRVIADIRPQMLEKVIENSTSRLDSIRASRGSPMPEIIFKIYVQGVAEFNCGRDSLVIKVTDSWPVYRDFEPSTAEDPTCRIAMHVKLVEMCFIKRGVVVTTGGVSSIVDLVTWPWFKTTMSFVKIPQVGEQCDVNIHSLILAEFGRQIQRCDSKGGEVKSP